MMRWKASLLAVAAVAVSLIGQAQERPQPITAPMKAQLAPPTYEKVASTPNVFGTSHTVFVTIPEWEFFPSAQSFGWGENAGNNPLRFSTVSGAFYYGSPHLPSGALLTSMEFDYCDDNATQDISVALFNMDYHNVVQFNLGSVTSTGQPGCTLGAVDLTPDNYTVDNNNQRLLIQVVFGTNADSTTRFAGVILGYQLQVSPAPGSATFPDVPTSDFGFQYVEALVASGITGGCGGGLYCPDSPVTRRQMAIFIAKALGLQFN